MRESRKVRHNRPWLIGLGVIILAVGLLVCLFGALHAVQFTLQPVFVTPTGAESSSLGFLITALFFFGFGAIFLIAGAIMIGFGARRARGLLI